MGKLLEKLKISKERFLLFCIAVLSVILNFTNLSIEGYSNQYYAAGVKSMTLNWKNFFFVALDPAGFVTIDKPPLGFWMQALCAKIFGFNGWSILIPQALAGVLSVVLIHHIVKKSFGIAAGLISALCLAVTPVFVAVSRNNTVDNQLVFALLLACWAISIAAEKGSFKYLALSMVFIGIGFNIKMLQAYMILPAIYVMYLFSNSTSLGKRIVHLSAGTVILLAVSLSWAQIVDSVPAANRPYVGSSNNNSVMGLITGHNGTERLNLGTLFGKVSESKGPGGFGGPGGGGAPGGAPPNGGPNGSRENPNFQKGQKTGYGREKNMPVEQGYMDIQKQPNANMNYAPPADNRLTEQGKQMPGDFPGAAAEGTMPNGEYMQGPPPADQGGQNSLGGAPGGGGTPPDGGGAGKGGPGGGSGLSGTFGNQTPAGITRLFSRNVLSDQIVWFIPLALIGFIAAAIRERLGFKLNNRKKQALALWFMWFLPEFVYFSFNTGLFHSYYLTMLAPPIAALAGIGTVSMWEMYREGGWKSWFLPVALLVNGFVQLLMLTYFISSTRYIKLLMVLLIVLCFAASAALAVLNIIKVRSANDDGLRQQYLLKTKKLLFGCAMAGLLIIPAAGSLATMFYAVNSSFPGAGLELLPSLQSSNERRDFGGKSSGENRSKDDAYSDLEAFLNNNKVNGKSQIVVGSANTSESITLNTDIYVGSLGGFMGNEKVMSLDQFKQKVKAGEVRFVLADSGNARGGMGGSNSEIMNWVKETGKLVSYSTNTSGSNTVNQGSNQVYDLIEYMESTE